MIEETRGDLLKSSAQALVNPVNCVGVMGKGLALQFKKAFPENFSAYKLACEKGEVQPGRVFVWQGSDLFFQKTIINFPTKRHWRDPSKLEDIESGLVALTWEINELKVESVAIPPIGCGLGGLSWEDVKTMIARAFETLPSVYVQLYTPFESASALGDAAFANGTRR